MTKHFKHAVKGFLQIFIGVYIAKLLVGFPDVGSITDITQFISFGFDHALKGGALAFAIFFAISFMRDRKKA